MQTVQKQDQKRKQARVMPGSGAWLVPRIAVWRRVLTLAVLSLVLALTAVPRVALSQSYEAGYNHYVKGDFVSAENAFNIALMRSPSQPDRARILKMLGISQYMQGKRMEAEESFTQAKRINPKIRISPSEVLDETVIGFFNSITPPPTYFGGDTRREPTNLSPTPGYEATPTYLQVTSNVPDAQVSIDGVMAGVAGQRLTVTPGTHEITVTARGYSKYSQQLSLAPERTNHLQVEFSRLPTKATVPPPEAVEPPRAASESDEAKAKRLRKEKTPPRRVDADMAQKKASSNNKKRRRRPGDRNDAPSSYPAPLVLLPFGGYQHLSERYGVGSAFTLLQGGALAWYYINWSKANSLVDETNTFVQQRDQENTLKSPGSERDAHFAETLKQVTARNAEIEALRSKRNLGLVAFGVAWGIGIGEALYFRSSEQHSASLSPAPTHQLATSDQEPARPQPATYSLQLRPSLPGNDARSHGLVMDFRLNF